MDPTQRILGFVRGEHDWRSLEKIGVSISVNGDGVGVFSDPSEPVVVTARDVATGWLRLSNQPEDLRVWAKVLMGAVGLIEFAFQDSGDEDALKDALWTVSFGGRLTRAMENLARRILLTSATRIDEP